MPEIEKVVSCRFLIVETRNGQEATFALKDLAEDDEIIGFKVVHGTRPIYKEDDKQTGA